MSCEEVRCRRRHGAAPLTSPAVTKSQVFLLVDSQIVDPKQLASLNVGRENVEATEMDSVVIRVPKRDGLVNMRCLFSTSKGTKRELDIVCNLILG